MTGIAITLALICAALCLVIWRLIQRAEMAREDFDNPERLPIVLLAMTKRVQYRGDWETLEDMRHSVRRALADIDRIRHDASNRALRDSKAHVS
ncbi:hypothetical protein [Cupriavidus sp. TMH.W2]|uniref:hypothetical protein n=1 Tax=Cupriavidus sp. TMH.W2 TaxID=3434465 RepID=UPI003D78776A